MRVLIIPEDFRNDQYILKPVVRRILSDAGKPNARVEVCTRPRLRGVQEALDSSTIQDIIETYPMVDAFVLIVDRDGLSSRAAQLADLEKKTKRHLRPGSTLIAEAAVEELEVWALAAEKLSAKQWADIRREHHPKERYFEPLVKKRGLSDSPGSGRRILGDAAARAVDRVKARCSELRSLAARLESFVEKG